LSGSARQKLKKARARTSKAETRDIQQPGNVGAPKQGETLTETLKRPRLEGSNTMETARPPKRPKEALTNIKIAIFKETYPEDKLIEDDQNSILQELGRVLHGTPIEEIPHLIYKSWIKSSGNTAVT
jgi:hypothetical protein